MDVLFTSNIDATPPNTLNKFIFKVQNNYERLFSLNEVYKPDNKTIQNSQPHQILGLAKKISKAHANDYKNEYSL